MTGVLTVEFHQLEAFVKVAENKSFSKAAASLFLTQPTVSSHIISLEKELNAKLFDRRGKEVELTPAGRILYEKAKLILEEKVRILEEIKHFLGTVEGELKICASSIPAVYILPFLIKKFNELYPGVKLKVHQADSGEVIRMVSDGEVEIGIVGTALTTDELVFESFMTDELVLITPACWGKKRFEKGKSVSIGDIIEERFVLREKTSGTRKVFEKALSDKGIKLEDLNVVAEFGSSEAVKHAVKEGIGISVVSQKAVLDYEKMGFINVYRIEDLDLRRNFYLVYKKCRTLSPNAATFKEFILNLIP